MPTNRVPFPTRIGLHLNTNRGADQAVAYARDVRPSAMKMLEVSPDLVRRIRAVSPATKIIYRPYWSDQKLDRHNEFRNYALGQARSFGAYKPDYVEGFNEWGGHGTSDREWDRFAKEEVEFAKLMNRHGFGAAIGGFSTGFLDENKRITAFREAFEYMNAVGPEACVYHGHEYAGPYMGYMCETPGTRDQWRDGWTGYAAHHDHYWNPQLEGWLTLRYRKLRRLLLAEGWDNVRMLVTESGVDDVNPRPGPANAKGWRDYHGSQWSSGPLGNFAEQMQWYAWQLSQDPFVIGAVDFGFATADPTWDSFDLAQTPDMLAAMTQLQSELEASIPDHRPDPTPEPTPPPVVVEPNTGRERMFVGIEVKRGEGMYAIARATSHAPDFTTVHRAARDLAHHNGLPWPPVIEPGQVLRVPYASINLVPPADAPKLAPPAELTRREQVRRLLPNLRIVDDQDERTAHQHQVNRATRPLFGVVLHDPAGNRKNPPSPVQVRRYLQSNTRKVSAHFFLEPPTDGSAVCTAYMLADPATHTVYHAGPSAKPWHGAMPGGRVTHSTVGIEAYRRADAPNEEPWPPAMVAAIEQLVSYVTRIYGLAPPDLGLVGHGEVQGNRTDPRGLDMDAMRRRTSQRYQLLVGSGFTRAELVAAMVD